MNDILMNMWYRQFSLLLLLNLSSAFDTFLHHHDSEFRQWSMWVGLVNLVSYGKITQRVAVNRGLSLALPLQRVVPQGSCLGLLLFTTYTSTCRSRSYRATFQACIAMQMTFRCTLRLVQVYRPRTRALPLVLCACECIWNLQELLVRDRLKLNDSRNELLLISNWQQLAKVNLFSISVRLSKSPFLVDYVIVRFQNKSASTRCVLESFLSIQTQKQ